MTLSINPTKQLIVCADDFGQNLPISDGIVDLLSHGRINAVSCMVNTDYWLDAYSALLPLKEKAYIGLHLNFTHGEALSYAWIKQYGKSFPSLPVLWGQSYLGYLKQDIVAAEIKAQLMLFSQDLGMTPDFVDGHQHIHQLPVFRDVLLNELGMEFKHSLFRNTSQGLHDFFSCSGFPKKQLISLLGGYAFRQYLTKQGALSNTSFSGIYPFKKAIRYPLYFKRFLAETLDGGMIMCHPGLLSQDHEDPLHYSRHHELNYFLSDDYGSDLSQYGFSLKKKNHDD